MIPALVSAAALASAQTLTYTGPANVPLGSSATLTLSIAGSAGQNVSGLQWTTTLPAGVILAPLPIVPPALAALGYTAQCGPTAICIMVDVPPATVPPAPPAVITPLTDGPVVTVSAYFPVTMGPAAVSFPITGIVAGAGTGGQDLSVTAGPVFTITTRSPCDVNNDGLVNIADVKAVLAGVDGTGVCPITVPNGGCTQLQVLAVVIAAAGGACTIR